MGGFSRVKKKHYRYTKKSSGRGGGGSSGDSLLIVLALFLGFIAVAAKALLIALPIIIIGAIMYASVSSAEQAQQAKVAEEERIKREKEAEEERKRQEEIRKEREKRYKSSVKVGEMQKTLKHIDKWCKYRNEVIHALFKDLDDLRKGYEQHVKEGMKLARCVDDQVKSLRNA